MDMLSPLFERLLTVEFLGWAVAVTSLAYGVKSYGVLVEKQIKGNQEHTDLLRQLINERTGMIERVFVLLDRIQASIDDVRMNNKA